MCASLYVIFRCVIFIFFLQRHQLDLSLIQPLVVQGQRSRRYYTYCLNRSCSAATYTFVIYTYIVIYKYIINYNIARGSCGACARACLSYIRAWRFYYKTIIFLFVVTYILCVHVYKISNDNNILHYVSIQYAERRVM
jgi:hypothetical protein